jgi:hypothetical protein
MMTALMILQFFHVLFLGLHDWVPLGKLNDLAAVRSENPTSKLVAGTLISTAPVAVGFAASLHYYDSGFPGWLWWWLWASYAFLFLGELQAWWIPYLLRPEPQRAARYAAMFGRTHAFLPEHNGMHPNSLHVILHGATVLTLVLLGLLTF